MEEVKGVIEEVSSFDQSADPSADFSAPLSLVNKTNEPYLSTVSQCKALWQLALPQFGMYSFEYEWANLISAYRCNSKKIEASIRRNQDNLEFEQDTRAQLFQNILDYMPRQFMKMREDEHLAERHRSLFQMLETDLMRHMEVNRSRQEEPSQVDFFVLNYSMSAFRAKYRDGMNMEKVRINFAPHAFMFEGCQPGDTRQVNIHVALYTPQNSASPSFSFDPNLHGIEECNPSDIGRIAVNPADFLCQNTLMEIHLHPVDNSGQMAVSPNNGAFLLNLTLPIVNFTIVMLHQTERGINKLSVLNISFLNDESLADCAILCALNSEMLLQSIITNSDDQEKNEDLEFVYLKRLKCAIETGVVSKLGNQSFLNSLFDEQQIRQLYHRKIWLTLGCPRIDDIGGKVHRELDLNWRINDFKRSLLTDTLIEDIFKTHQALLAYGESKHEY